MHKLSEIMSILPSSSIFSLSTQEYSFINHIPEDVELAQSEFIKYCVSRGVLSKKFLNDKVHRQGIVGRYLDDCGEKDIKKLVPIYMH